MKKYDYKKDDLKVAYDINKDEYIYMLNGRTAVSDKDISFRSKRHLQKVNKTTPEAKRVKDKEIALVLYNMDESKRVDSFFANDRKNNGIHLNYGSFSSMGGKVPTFSEPVKKYLDELTADEHNNEYLVGIHRIGNLGEVDTLEGLFSQGIIVNGHQMGAAKGQTDLATTISYYPRNKQIVGEVGKANSYKNSTGSIVVKIPFEDIETGKLYVSDEKGNVYLDPQYIVGYFTANKDNHVEAMYDKDTIKGYIQRLKGENVKAAESFLSSDTVPRYYDDIQI